MNWLRLRLPLVIVYTCRVLRYSIKAQIKDLDLLLLQDTKKELVNYTGTCTERYSYVFNFEICLYIRTYITRLQII